MLATPAKQGRICHNGDHCNLLLTVQAMGTPRPMVANGKHHVSKAQSSNRTPTPVTSPLLPPPLRSTRSALPFRMGDCLSKRMSIQ